MKKSLKSHATELKVAIVHDWLIGGGAEKVVLELHKMFPDAPIYTTYCSDDWRRKLDNKVVTGYLQKFGKFRKFLPVMQMLWFRGLNLSGYDIVISSSGNGYAKHVRVKKPTTHINYCHTPPHYLWRHYDLYMKTPGFGPFNPMARLGLKILLKPLRRLDYTAAQRVDEFIANSSHIQADIRQYYGRESTVIHPPVDVERFSHNPKIKRSGFVVVGRQVPQKRIDLAIQACSNLNLPLIVVGQGPEHENLVKMAGPSVSFVANASDSEVAQYMRSAKAFIFTSEDDFGITPVEAMASGTPVIAYKAGGALDYVIEGKTGLFFAKQTVVSLEKSLKAFPHHTLNSESIVNHSKEFSLIMFKQRFRSQVKN